MDNKKSNSLAPSIILLIFLILIAIFYSLFVYYYNNHHTDIESVSNRNLSNEELNILSNFLDSTKNYYLNMIFTNSMEVNYNKNLLTSSNKQFFVISYIRDKENVKLYDDSYVDRELFDKYLLQLFNDSDIELAYSNSGGEYDNDNFVYFNKSTLESDYLVDNVEILSSVYDGYNRLYSALLKINYNEALSLGASHDSDSCVISFYINDDYLVLNSFKVRLEVSDDE